MMEMRSVSRSGWIVFADGSRIIVPAAVREPLALFSRGSRNMMVILGNAYK